MLVNLINHVQVSIPIGAEEEARAFYVKVLGLFEVPKPDILRSNGGLWLEAGNIQIHLGCENNVNRSATKSHVAYEVTDLALIKDRLALNNAVILDSKQIPGYQRFETRDPFGNRIEVMSKNTKDRSEKNSAAAAIQMSPYTPKWKEEYKALHSQLLNCPGIDVKKVDHIGSTSVENLSAKDVIDIQITLEDLGDKRIIMALESLGYVHVPDVKFDNLVGFSAGSIELRKHFFREQSGGRRVHIHVRESGRVNQEYAILFRDFLRANNDVKEAYERVKIELADRFKNDAQAYYAIKDPYMDTIYKAAKFWARETGWSQ